MRKMYILGAVLGLLAVILGAFGAHGLQGVIDEKSLTSFETGVRYQMYHAFLCFIIGGVFNFSLKFTNTLFWLVLIGIILFSGSIYALATQQLTKIDFSSIALLTPLGGTLLILSWLLILIKCIKR